MVTILADFGFARSNPRMECCCAIGMTGKQTGGYYFEYNGKEKQQPVEEEVSLLCEIPGIKRTSAIDILAEIGVDMEVFPTDAHIASWAGLSPGNNESAGKKKLAYEPRQQSGESGNNRMLMGGKQDQGHLHIVTLQETGRT